MSVKPVYLTCACVLSCFNQAWLCATLWILAHQAPLSLGISRQEYWSGLPCPTPEVLLYPGTELPSLMSPALVGGFFTTSATWEAHTWLRQDKAKLQSPLKDAPPRLFIYTHLLQLALLKCLGGFCWEEGCRLYAAVMSLSWDEEKVPPLPGRAFSSSSLGASISRGETKWGLSPEKHHLTVERQWVKPRLPSDLQGGDEERNSKEGGVSSTTLSSCWYSWSVSHSAVSSFCDPWAGARQAPLSVGFSRQEYWSGWPFPFSRGSSQPRDQTPQTFCIAGRCFTICHHLTGTCEVHHKLTLTPQ